MGMGQVEHMARRIEIIEAEPKKKKKKGILISYRDPEYEIR